jgi:hypothetical protein
LDVVVSTNQNFDLSTPKINFHDPADHRYLNALITPQAAMIKKLNTQTNTHLKLTQLLHFNNVGSSHGLANDTPIVFYYFPMVLKCH